MISRLIDLPLQQNTMESAKLATIVITPNLEGYTSADFLKGTEMIPLGYKAAEAAAGEARGVVGARERLRRLEAGPRRAAGAACRSSTRSSSSRCPTSTRGGSTYLVETKAGRVLDTKILGSDLKRIYALGIFEIVSYSVTEEDKKNVLRIKATPKSWGPTYLKLGLALGTDFQFTTEFGVVGLVDATELNRLGGQWKTTFTRRESPRAQVALLSAAQLRGAPLRVALRGVAAAERAGLRRPGRRRHLPGLSRGRGLRPRLRLRDLGRAARRIRCGPSGKARARSATPSSPT